MKIVEAKRSSPPSPFSLARKKAPAKAGSCSRRSLPLRIIVALLLFLTVPALARDDGRYANSPLKGWFESLRSQKGYCCAEADGRETEFDMRENRYWVPVNGVWTAVPDEALITEPNKLGRPMLWLDQLDRIRCFIPGSGT